MADRLTGFDMPTFDELLAQARAAYAARLATNPQLPRGVVYALALVDAMLAFGLYGVLDVLAGQTLPLYATGDNLDAWGRMLKLARTGAVRASGQAAATGEEGRTIPAGALWVSDSDDGQTYKTIADAVIAAGTATVELQAVTAGEGGNRVTAETLTLIEAIEGIDVTATVISIAGGAEAEQDGAPGVAEYYRGRILERLRMPPHGGNDADHIAWAKEAGVSVSKAWVEPATADSPVVWLRFLIDGVTVDGIPSAADVATVAAYLETQRPVGEVELRVRAPAGVPLDVTISGLTPDTAEVRAAIAAELADMIVRQRYPGCTVYRSWVGEAISTADGEEAHTLVEPAADITYASGEVPVLGEVNFV